MRIFRQESWIDGFADYAVHSSHVALRVTRWLVLDRVGGQYFERPRSLRMVWNYLVELGPQQVWRKVRSRSAEAIRNEKYLSVGLGIDPEGKERVFVACSHPGGVDRIVLPEALTRVAPDARPATDLRRAVSQRGPVPAALAALAGWSPYAGVLVPHSADALDAAQEMLAQPQDWTAPAPLAPLAPTPEAEAVRGKERSAMLFGYGNYAKLYILPNIGPEIRMARISEIDPTQIPLSGGPAVAWTTRPGPAPEDRFDVFFAAGYHHTHAAVAIHALEQGATAVIEKPVVTDDAQLAALVKAMDNHDGRFFACFHKRYSPLTALAKRDLGAPAGAPIDYHCVVYEVPLPPLHWYRWPNSQSRIISNGCHWIDQFLFLNDYSPPVTIEGTMAPNGTMQCAMVLENGAFFSMTLTEIGSERLGVRDYIELRHGTVTVRMTDSSRYHAEDTQRVIRTVRVNRTDSYRDMYKAIAARIAADEPGDSRASVAVGAKAVLDVERSFRERYPHQFAAAAA
jgi:predicted dehydrogenase